MGTKLLPIEFSPKKAKAMLLHFALVSLVAWIAGFVGGLTGLGGVVLAPSLIAFFGAPPHYAMAAAQASFIFSAAMAAVMFIRKGQIDWKLAIPMTLAGCVCAFLTAAYLKPRLAPGVLTGFFAVCVIASGVAMLRKSRAFSGTIRPFPRIVGMTAAGALVGGLAGITGAGSNAMLVPLMVFCGVDILVVLGCCNVYVFVASLAGTVGNVMNMPLDATAVFWLVAGQLAGIWSGVRLAQRMDTGQLKKWVGAVCLLVGLYLFAKSFYA